MGNTRILKQWRGHTREKKAKRNNNLERKKFVVLRMSFGHIWVCCCMFLLLGSLPSGPNCTNLQCECFQMPKQYISIYIHTRTHTLAHTQDIPDLFYFSLLFLSRRLCVKILDSCVCFRTLLLSLGRSFEHQYYRHRMYRGRCMWKYYECATVCQSVCAHIAEHTLARSTCTCVRVDIRIVCCKCALVDVYTNLNISRYFRCFVVCVFQDIGSFLAYVCVRVWVCLYFFYLLFVNERDIELSLSS